MNTIEKIYYGEISPNIHRFADDSAFLEAGGLIDANEEYLREALEEKEFQKVLEIINAEDNISAESSYQSFAEGFRLGAGLILDIFTEQKEAE